MDERKTVKTVEKRTEVTREDRVREPKTTNVNIGSDGSTQVQEESEVVDDPVSSTIITQEETIERHPR